MSKYNLVLTWENESTEARDIFNQVGLYKILWVIFKNRNDYAGYKIQVEKL